MIKHGIAPDMAFNLSNDMRVAFLVIFGEMAGGEFDWGSGKWAERG